MNHPTQVAKSELERKELIMMKMQLVLAIGLAAVMTALDIGLKPDSLPEDNERGELNRARRGIPPPQPDAWLPIYESVCAELKRNGGSA